MNIGVKIQLFGIALFFITIIIGTILYINDPYVFCIKGQGHEIDEEDKYNCFKTLKEQRAFAEYLNEKYKKDDEIILNIGLG